MPVEESLMCKKNVLYIGSSVPLETSEGLDAIQQPLKDHYPVDEGSTIAGMKSTLTVLPTGLQLLLNDDDSGTIIWFPITSLSLCAAVRCINTINTATGERVARFVSLSSPAAQGSNSKRPAIFTAITRRTKGKKVLECHGFVCESSRDALELVQTTSTADKLSKQRVNGTSVHSPQPYGLDTSVKSSETNTLRASTTQEYRASTTQEHRASTTQEHRPSTTQEYRPSTTQEYPVRLIPGDKPHTSNGLAPEFMDNPPEHGYFYSTTTSKVKQYTVDAVSDAEDYSSPPHMIAKPAGDRRSVYSQPVTSGPMHPGAAMTLPHPRQHPGIPIRAVHGPPPAFMAPPPQMIRRGRFFSPPPPQLMRPRMMMYPRQDPHVFMPPAPVYVDAPLVVRRRPTRRGSHSSEGSGSSRSSSPRNLHDETFPKRPSHNHENGDLSSELSSRPRTPPTDYDLRGRGPRISRRDEYELRQRPPYIGGPPPPPNYMMYGPRYPYMYMDRARSVPPPEDRSRGKKDKKNKHKKDKKKAKKDKKGKKRMYGVPGDSTDSYSGYVSENPNMLDRSFPRIPRDFRKQENMNMSERAFSKNLEAQTRNSVRLDQSAVSAYSLNDHMVSKAHGEDEFNMY